MNNKQQSKKLLLTSTALVIIALASLLSVYAAIIGSFDGDKVVIGGVNGEVQYSADNSTGWATTLTQSSTTWYAKFVTTSGGYSGPVTITWQLQNQTGASSWSDVGSAQTTNVVLNGTVENVYVSSNGGQTANYNWGTLATTQGTYRIHVTFASV